MDWNLELGSDIARTTEHSKTVTFTLGDDDFGDSFDVMIGTDPVFATPVFLTLGGVSSCPWEGNTAIRQKIQFHGQTTWTEIDVGGNVRAGMAFNRNLELAVSGFGNQGTFTQFSLLVNYGSNPDMLDVELGPGGNSDLFLPAREMASTHRIPISVSRGPYEWSYTNLEIRAAPTCEVDTLEQMNSFDHLKGADLIKGMVDVIPKNCVKEGGDCKATQVRKEWATHVHEAESEAKDILTIKQLKYDATCPAVTWIGYAATFGTLQDTAMGLQGSGVVREGDFYGAKWSAHPDSWIGATGAGGYAGVNKASRASLRDFIPLAVRNPDFLNPAWKCEPGTSETQDMINTKCVENIRDMKLLMEIQAQANNFWIVAPIRFSLHKPTKSTTNQINGASYSSPYNNNAVDLLSPSLADFENKEEHKRFYDRLHNEGVVFFYLDVKKAMDMVNDQTMLGGAADSHAKGWTTAGVSGSYNFRVHSLCNDAVEYDFESATATLQGCLDFEPPKVMGGYLPESGVYRPGAKIGAFFDRRLTCSQPNNWKVKVVAKDKSGNTVEGFYPQAFCYRNQIDISLKLPEGSNKKYSDYVNDGVTIHIKLGGSGGNGVYSECGQLQEQGENSEGWFEWNFNLEDHKEAGKKNGFLARHDEATQLDQGSMSAMERMMQLLVREVRDSESRLMREVRDLKSRLVRAENERDGNVVADSGHHKSRVVLGDMSSIAEILEKMQELKDDKKKREAEEKMKSELEKGNDKSLTKEERHEHHKNAKAAAHDAGYNPRMLKRAKKKLAERAKKKAKEEKVKKAEKNAHRKLQEKIRKMFAKDTKGGEHVKPRADERGNVKEGK